MLQFETKIICVEEKFCIIGDSLGTMGNDCIDFKPDLHREDID